MSTSPTIYTRPFGDRESAHTHTTLRDVARRWKDRGCRVTPDPYAAADPANAQAAEIARLTQLAKQNNADAEMYARAWQRELAGFLRPKGHHIDMLVVSTRDLVERCRKAETRVKQLEQAAQVAPPAERAPAAPDPDESGQEPCALPALAMLIDRLEAADEPSAELDEEIAREVGCISAPTPRYTASFDAALTLIEPGKDYELVCYGSGPDGATYTCAGFKWWPRPDDQKGWRSESGNKLLPALALCIAALKVRLARMEECGIAPAVRSSAEQNAPCGKTRTI